MPNLLTARSGQQIELRCQQGLPNPCLGIALRRANYRIVTDVICEHSAADSVTVFVPMHVIPKGDSLTLFALLGFGDGRFQFDDFNVERLTAFRQRVMVRSL